MDDVSTISPKAVQKPLNIETKEPAAVVVVAGASVGKPTPASTTSAFQGSAIVPEPVTDRWRSVPAASRKDVAAIKFYIKNTEAELNGVEKSWFSVVFGAGGAKLVSAVATVVNR